MKTIRKIMEGGGRQPAYQWQCITCFLEWSPARGQRELFIRILDGIFCISAWVAGVGILWYVRWLRRRNKELENMIKILLKNADKLDK